MICSNKNDNCDEEYCDCHRDPVPHFSLDEIYSEKQQKDRAGWGFLVLTLIVAGYFFVWAWTNF